MPTDIVPHNHLAFRSITGLLSQFPHARMPEALAGTLTDLDRKALRTLNSVTHLAVEDHEVVASVADPDFGSLDVLVCDNIVGVDKTPNARPQELVPWWRVLLTKNPRRNDSSSSKPVDLGRPPTIISAPKTPEGPIEAYLDNLEKKWEQPTKEVHLWTLGQLLLAKAQYPESAVYPRFMKYSIAMCAPKMLNRLEHEYSLIYIKALKALKNFPFQNAIVKDLVGTTAEIASDRSFLEDFVSMIKEDPAILPVPIPNIIRVFDQLTPDEDFKLYTNETRVEFHNTLIYLLDHLAEELRLLTVAKEKHEDITTTLDTIYLDGSALSFLARGHAIQLHFRTIEEHLVHTYNHSRFDEEISSLHDENDSFLTRWRLYQEWLFRMIIHFDATRILSSFASSGNFKYQNVSIKILEAPTPDNECLSWDVLLADTKIFPDDDPTDPKNPVTGKALTNLIRTAMSEHSAALTHQHLCDTMLEDRDAGCRRLHLGTLTRVPRYSDAAKFALDAVDKKMDEVEIQKKLKFLKGQVDDKLELVALPVNFYRKFEGTLHCEAILATLLNPEPRAAMAQDVRYTKVLTATEGLKPNFGVSKRTCPTCQRLLTSLSSEEMTFVTRSSHSTLTSCSLPLWTPAHIVDSMNEAFGRVLRRELEMLVTTRKTKGRGGRSVDSDTFSVDSSDAPAPVGKSFKELASGYHKSTTLGVASPPPPSS
ncbi:hypothetical protein GALMADRAFT_212135 [Galerina marginata CBS 339.88]|uniref:Uncharacterized protein n=1 Tax=Galerina marginata (strain CBS 339.88) TaxID=685588 RepID=A0A067SSG9_GALM3|nr:hypothetical protein GALMADRAFT_212135 [Galerina marginata CBS 339.88]